MNNIVLIILCSSNLNKWDQPVQTKVTTQYFTLFVNLKISSENCKSNVNIHIKSLISIVFSVFKLHIKSVYIKSQYIKPYA